MQEIEVVDSHTGGEPTRVVLAGFPDLGGGPLDGRRRRLDRDCGALRLALTTEPRASLATVLAILTPPTCSAHATGVLYADSGGSLGMCGHGTIGLVHTLAAIGRLGAGRHSIETPVGPVEVELHADGAVSVDNVESYRFRKEVSCAVPGHGHVTGDIAWGGNWFFITGATPVALEPRNRDVLEAFTRAIRRALEEEAITGEGGAVIDHIELHAPASSTDADSRNFVLCPTLTYDRSPCGTGTSARLACLAADGRLAPGETFRQEGFTGSRFEASYRPGTRGIRPRIRGRAHLLARARLLFEPDDPLLRTLARNPDGA
jgi:proline racemase